MLVIVKTLRELRKLEINVENTYLLRFRIGNKSQLVISGKKLIEIIKETKKEE